MDAAPDARELKLLLFRRLQARGPPGAWRDYWRAFQRFLAARASAAELHATALALLGDDIQLHNRLVVALLAAPFRAAGGGSAARVEDGGKEENGVEAADAGREGDRQHLEEVEEQQLDTAVQIKQEPEEPPTAEHTHHHHRHHHRHHRHHHHHHVEPKREQHEHNGHHEHEALGRKRSFSSISTANSGLDDHGSAVNKLLHLASSSHDHHHHADDDHQSASLLIGLGRSNAQISPLTSDGERSRSPNNGDSSSEHGHDSGG